jgi:hypothetical protein
VTRTRAPKQLPRVELRRQQIEFVCEQIGFTEKELGKHLLMSASPDALLGMWIQVAVWKYLQEQERRITTDMSAQEAIRLYTVALKAFFALVNSNLPRKPDVATSTGGAK